MTLDELLVEWSYRTKKGYPDMDNPSDILILENILKKLDMPFPSFLNEQEEEAAEPKEETFEQKVAKVRGVYEKIKRDYDKLK